MIKVKVKVCHDGSEQKNVPEVNDTTRYSEVIREISPMCLM